MVHMEMRERSILSLQRTRLGLTDRCQLSKRKERAIGQKQGSYFTRFCSSGALAILTVEDSLNLSLVHIHHILNSTDFCCLPCQGCYLIPGYMFYSKLPTSSH